MQGVGTLRYMAPEVLESGVAPWLCIAERPNTDDPKKTPLFVQRI